MNSVILEGKARAKINLHLSVLNRRSDGYHDILSLMAGLELHDLLKLLDYRVYGDDEATVSIIPDGGGYSDILAEISPGENLISAGVKKYLASAGIGGEFTFSLRKNIPSGAGLGGGSSDAACAIELVRRALGFEKNDHYYKSAAETGSDVPFFLYGGFAFASGRGEILKPVDFRSDSYVLLINNGIHVNTGAAYKALNKAQTSEGIPVDIYHAKILKSLPDVKTWKDLMYNDFETVIFKDYPELGVLKKELYQAGAIFAAMTGSGSTVFGVFDDYKRAESAADILKKSNNVIETKFDLSKN